MPARDHGTRRFTADDLWSMVDAGIIAEDAQTSYAQDRATLELYVRSGVGRCWQVNLP